MTRLVELTEKALSSGLTEEENNEFETLWNSGSEGFNEAAELMQTEALLSGVLFETNVEKAVFEEILSRSSDRAANGVLKAIRSKKEPLKRDFNSIRRREKAGYYPLIYSIAALLVIGFTVYLGLSKVQTETLASVSSTDGLITLKRHGQESHLSINSAIQSGDQLITDEKSKANVSLIDGTAISIEESTAILLNKVNDAWELSLSAGTVKTKVSPQRKEFRLKTPALEVKVLGTQFAVTHINGISTITVFEGKVAATSFSDGKSTTLTAGQSFSADKTKILSDTSAENLLYAESFENGSLSPLISFAKVIQTNNTPPGNNSKWCIESLVSSQTDPKKKKYEVRGPQWDENNKGLFTYKPGMKIKFKYWINEKNFWIGVWMRVNNRNINLYKSLEKPAVKQWTEAEVDLSTITSQTTGQKLNTGDIINRLNLQSNPDSKAVFYIDDVRIVAE